MNKILLTIFPILFFILIPFSKNKELNLKDPLYLIGQEHWVDSTFRSLDEKQKIGQLFMIEAYSNQTPQAYRKLEEKIKKYHVGGLVFFQGAPHQQAQLTNRYQKASNVPLLIGIDAEWGLGMRLDSTLSYPKQMTLGAIKDKKMLYAMGQEIAIQAQKLGIHLNLAPVVDINTNANNPVIGMRSFGDDKEEVSQRAKEYIKGMQSKGLLACAKHFPGHGDTKEDSHLTMPTLNHSAQRLDSLELYPFQQVINLGVESIMIAHIYVSVLEEQKTRRRKLKRTHIPASLSKKIIKRILKDKMKYKGLVITDALNMKGVQEYSEGGKIEVMALKAGNDILLMPKNLEKSIEAIQTALKQNILNKADITSKIKKILRAKYKAGLGKYKPINTVGLTDTINKRNYTATIQSLYANAITLVQNNDKLLPIKRMEANSFASLSIAHQPHNITFQEHLSHYATFEHYTVPKNQYNDQSHYDYLYKALSKKTIVFVNISNINRTEQHSFKESIIPFLQKLKQKTRVVITLFGSPYNLQHLSQFDNIICAYEPNTNTAKLVPQQIFGAYAFKGALPIQIGNIKRKTGAITQSLHRLKYATNPEEAGINSKRFKKIDAIIASAIKNKYMPGAQVFVARNGIVAWNKAYGYYDYTKNNKVTKHTIFDLASITKVAATTQVIMFLYEQGQLDLSKKASFYVPSLIGTNKEHITIRQLLLHRAGLVPFMLHWKKTMNDGNLNPVYYSNQKSVQYPLQVANNLYAHKDMEKIVWQWTVDSKMSPKQNGKYPYKYSDLSYYTLKKVAENILKQPVEEFLKQNFYEPLGADKLGFNPLERYKVSEIMPSEAERTFRKRRIQGTVHDPGAAMIGGVGGHAGIFSNANDLGKWAQMLLQNGGYGNTRYFKSETIKLFTSLKTTHYKSRRGYGWDKPPNGVQYSYIPTFGSHASFGHSGFTGTVVWIDPIYDLQIIILTNRTYPYSGNSGIIKRHIRRKIQDQVYLGLLDVSLKELKRNVK